MPCGARLHRRCRKVVYESTSVTAGVLAVPGACYQASGRLLLKGTPEEPPRTQLFTNFQRPNAVMFLSELDRRGHSENLGPGKQCKVRETLHASCLHRPAAPVGRRGLVFSYHVGYVGQLDPRAQVL
jgi:hypothetical protein